MKLFVGLILARRWVVGAGTRGEIRVGKFEDRARATSQNHQIIPPPVSSSCSHNETACGTNDLSGDPG
jgi:hypothetical protein